MYCKKCGQELPDNSAFCSGCGAPVQDPPIQDQQDLPSTSAYNYPPPKKKHGCLIAVIAVVWLFIILTITIIVLDNSDDGATSVNSANDSTDADNTAEQTSIPSPTQTPKPDLEIIEAGAPLHENYVSYISGVVKNNTNKTYSYVQITYSLYDADENLIGTAFDNITNLEPGGTWKFKALVLNDSDISGFKLSDLIGY